MTAPEVLLSRLELAMVTMARLPREIFLAHRLDGFAFDAIATRTGLSVRQVELQLAIAIAHIDRTLAAMESQCRP